MIGANAAAERILRARAIAEAAELFAHHGDAAADLLTDRVYDPSLPAEERRRYRLIRVEIERLGRARRNLRNPHALAVWRPPLFSLGGLARLFGFPRNGARRDRRP